jgi:hypothetical protein
VRGGEVVSNREGIFIGEGLGLRLPFLVISQSIIMDDDDKE